jgi:hypothetical protein
MFAFDEEEFEKEVIFKDYEAITVPWKDLKPFQGRLKVLSKESFEKLKYRILKGGFRFPPFVWIDGNDHYLLDGHQRRAALAKMEKQGYKIPKDLKVIHIPASSYDEAKEMVLELISQYGKVTEDGLMDFTAGMVDDLTSFDFPSFTLDDTPDFEDPENNEDTEDPENYSRKIEPPIYEPKGEKPEVKDLVDISKVKSLVREIEASILPSHIKSFLRTAAHRHAVFNYENIAEYYAQASKEEQRLFEKSALVIIDFESAIENGFVHMSKEIAKSFLENQKEL